MKCHNPATDKSAKESPTDSFTSLGTNFEQTIFHGSSVRHSKIRAVFRHLFGDSGEARLNPIRLIQDFVLNCFAIKLKAAIQKNIAYVLLGGNCSESSGGAFALYWHHITISLPACGDFLKPFLPSV